MLENTISAPRLSCSAERSAVLADMIADVLRGSGGLFEGVPQPLRLPIRMPRQMRMRMRVRMKVSGESMLPSLWPGDEVEIANCSLDDVRPGEIVLALRDGRLFLHRLVAIKPNGFMLRGDSVPGPDPLYPTEAVLGRLVRRASRLKSGANWLGWKCSRAVGMLLCHCAVARRLALRLHSRRRASARELRSPDPAVDLTSTEAGAW